MDGQMDGLCWLVVMVVDGLGDCFGGHFASLPNAVGVSSTSSLYHFISFCGRTDAATLLAAPTGVVASNTHAVSHLRGRSTTSRLLPPSAP